jgi:hypothetical protein
MWITLPHYANHRLHISTLIRELINRQTDYIIQGQQNTSYENHSKKLSLDYWIRTIANNSNTKQATNNVINQICDTGLFEVIEDLTCPEMQNPCKGIRLVHYDGLRENN